MSDTTDTVLVTGASGFIGSHCIIKLLNEGYAVRGTLRNLDRGDSIKTVIGKHAPTENLNFVVADLSQDNGWDEAVTGCEYVLHVASPLPRVLPKNHDELIIPAREGALRVLRAAAQKGVKRVVMTASTASVFYGKGNTGVIYTENDWSDPEHPDNSAYTRSKTYAERAAWEFMESDNSGLELACINPGAVLGPVLEQDYGTSPEMILKLLKGDFPGMPQMGFPIVDVRDVADLHLLAMKHPNAAGERFLCAGEFMWFADMARVLREAYPNYAKKMPDRKLPNWLIKLSALFDPVTRGVTFELGIARHCDSSKAKDVLGWQPRDSATAIKATADTMMELGLV